MILKNKGRETNHCSASRFIYPNILFTAYCRFAS